MQEERLFSYTHRRLFLPVLFISRIVCQLCVPLHECSQSVLTLDQQSKSPRTADKACWCRTQYFSHHSEESALHCQGICDQMAAEREEMLATPSSDKICPQPSGNRGSCTLPDSQQVNLVQTERIRGSRRSATGTSMFKY